MKLMIAAAGFAALLASQASAVTYQYSADNVNGVDATFTYDSAEEVFSLDFGVDATDGVDGAWWVVNDGPSPQGRHEGSLRDLYTDLTDVWAYQYTGGYSRPASNNGPLLEKWSGAVSSSLMGDLATYSLSLDVTDLKAMTGLDPEWEAIGFDDTIGTWLHPVIGSQATVDANGGLSFFDGRNWLGWDQANRQTEVVPLPASVAFLLAGLGGLGIAGRRRKS